MSGTLKAGQTAVVTGAALGIGKAAVRRFADAGLRVVLIDRAHDELAQVASEIAATVGPTNVLASSIDVTDAAAMARLAGEVTARFGTVSLLMNNAATRVGGGVLSPIENWRIAFEVNFWGAMNGVNAFLPTMLKTSGRGYIVNVGSKQGITNPPGNAAYNATKAALKFYTESLQHELRGRAGCNVTAHLLVPGWTTTGTNERKPGAWLPEQVVDRMLNGLSNDDFYIVCPDNEVTSEMDRQRILWAATDITDDRPALSRWHGEFGDAFKAFRL